MTVLRIEMVLLAVVGAGLGVVFGAAPFLPRRRWVWVYGFVPICIGLTSCCCIPASLPLLIYWIRPETQRFFGPPLADAS